MVELELEVGVVPCSLLLQSRVWSKLSYPTAKVREQGPSLRGLVLLLC